MDARRRYLAQQAELGGREVYLTGEHRAAEPESVSPERARNPASPPRMPPEPPEAAAATTNPPAPPEPMPDDIPAAAGSRFAVLPRSDPDAGPNLPKWRKDAPPIPGPGVVVVPPDAGLLGDAISQAGTLEAVAGMIATCRKCALCEGRTNTVPGEGNPAARLMCVGEGPGATEDETGRPFVGAAGQLLDQILAAIECPRSTVYIANIVKCRPPQNRKPLPDEANSCLPYLHRQIALVRPKVLLALGGTAAEWLLGTRSSLGQLRGRVHRFAGIPLVVTYHPAALLRNPNWKRPTWDDVRIARQLLDR